MNHSKFVVDIPFTVATFALKSMKAEMEIK